MFDARTTFRSAVWNHAGKILEYVLMYLTSVLIARGLGVQENGTFVGLFSISQLLLVLTSFGLEVSLNKHIPQITGNGKSEHIRYVLRQVFAARILSIVVVVLCLLAVLRSFPGLVPLGLNQFIWLLLAYTTIRSVVSLFIVVLTAELRTRLSSLINVLTRALEVMLIGSQVMGELTTSAVLAILLMTATLQLCAYMIVAKAEVFGKVAKTAILPVMIFGGIYWANNVVEYFLGRQGDVLLLTALLPDTTQASLYDVSFTVAQLASLSLTIGLGGITLATSARLALEGSGRLELFYGFMIRVTSLLTIPLYAFVLLNPKSVLSVMYSSKYLAGAGIIQGIAAFRIVSRLFGGPENAEFLLSRSMVSRLVGIGLVGAMINVGLDILLIPKLGALGAVVGSGLGNCTANALGAWAVCRISSARIQWQFWLKISFVACTISFTCSMLIPSSSYGLIGAQVMLFVILLPGAMFFLKPLTTTDGIWLSKVNSKLAAPLLYFVRTDTKLA